MSTSPSSQWIALTDARPSAGDYPIWLAIAGRDDVRPYLCHVEGPFPGGMPTHWCHAEVPKPPVRLLLRERDLQDCAAFIDWVRGPGKDTSIPASSVLWHAAIAYERAAIREIVDDTEIGANRALGIIGRRVEAASVGNGAGGLS